MNQSDRICGVMSRAARGVVAVVCLAVLCGCGTMLAKVRSIASDEVLYLVKGALGETEAQREAAVRIVEDQLDDRLERTAVPEGTRELALWRAREEALEEPVVIDGESYKSAPELRNVSDRDRVATYVSTHPEALSLSGSEYSEAWETALSEAKAKASSLEIERKQLLKQADAAVSAKDHLKALVAYAAALEITPGEKDLVNKSVQSASDAWKGVKDGMEKNVLAKAETLKDSPVEWDEFQKNLLTKQDQVLDYLRSVNSVKVGGKALLTDERRKEAAALLQQSSEALAGVWQKYGDYLVGRSDYWMFYKFIAACLESAETKPALKSGTLAEKVRGMYVANLGDGMKHFIDTASAAYDRDQYGVSYVFCLMAEEMLDFARAKDMKVPSDATDKLEFARSIEKDATEKIAAQHNRRLLILDFLPAVTEEGGQVAYQARTLCNKKYEPANDLAWRLTVPQGKILTQNMVEPLDPADTVISGEIKEITINAAPVREYDQEFIEVGSPNIIEVVVEAPIAARAFQPGQFYRLQNFETRAKHVDGTILAMEGLALTGAQVDREKGLLSTIVLEMGGSSDLCAMLEPGEPVVLMGPTGTPTETPAGETVMLVGGGLGNAVLFSIGQTLRAHGSRVIYFAGYKKMIDRYKIDEIERAADCIIWCCDEAPGFERSRPGDRGFVGNIVEAIKWYGTEVNSPIRLQEVERIIAIGSDRMMAAVGQARHTVLKDLLPAGHVAIASINSPMQCMMKEICAQCLQKHKDPVTGKERVVFSCFNQDQPLDEVDFGCLNERLGQNGLQEKLTRLWIDRSLKQLGLREELVTK